MAYMRGDNYIWKDESGIHFWSSNGYDSWDTTSWAVDEEENRLTDRIDASGTSVPLEVVDEFVVMHLAQLLEAGKLIETIARTTADDYMRGGNFGHAPLLRQAKAIARALKPLDGSKSMPPEPKAGGRQGSDAPCALADLSERERRLGLLKNSSAQPLFDYVENIRAERGLEREIPYLDPCDGGIDARVLFLLEAPGPKAVESGFISQNNPDPTARNFCGLVNHVEIDRQDIVIWNIVPWYLGTGDKILPATRSDVVTGLVYLGRLLEQLPRLEMIILVGKQAQSAAAEIQKLTDLPVQHTHHMSARVFNVWPEKRAETEAAFKRIAEALGKGLDAT